MYVRKIVTALFAMCLPIFGAAQSSSLRVPDFEALRAKATETVDVHIGAWPLRIFAAILDEEDPEDAEMKELIGGLRGVHVRSYEFAEDDAYSKADIESVRKQLAEPGWHQLVHVSNRDEHSELDIYVALDDNKPKGLALVASEPRSFTILHIVGTIDLEKLDKLEGHVGVPRINLGEASVRARL